MEYDQCMSSMLDHLTSSPIYEKRPSLAMNLSDAQVSSPLPVPPAPEWDPGPARLQALKADLQDLRACVSAAAPRSELDRLATALLPYLSAMDDKMHAMLTSFTSLLPLQAEFAALKTRMDDASSEYSSMFATLNARIDDASSVFLRLLDNLQAQVELKAPAVHELIFSDSDLEHDADAQQLERRQS